MKWTDSPLGSALHDDGGRLIAKVRPLGVGGVSAQWCNGMRWDVSGHLSQVKSQSSRGFKSVPEAKRAIKAALAAAA